MNYFNCIYMYVNKTNGKRYVGQAKDFNRRHKQHIRKSANKLLIDRAIKKYGIDKFDIIILKENLENQEQLNYWECYYIEKLNTLNLEKGYNVASGGSNGNVFAGKTEEEMKEIFNDEWKQKQHEINAGKKNPSIGGLINRYDLSMDYIDSAYQFEYVQLFDFDASSISKCCQFWEMNCDKNEWYKTHKRNPQKSHKGFIFKYHEKD